MINKQKKDKQTIGTKQAAPICDNDSYLNKAKLTKIGAHKSIWCNELKVLQKYYKKR